MGALELMETALILREQLYGAQSEEVHTSCREVADVCNSLGMLYLQKEEMGACLQLQRRAEATSVNRTDMLAITSNNLACYYRR